MDSDWEEKEEKRSSPEFEDLQAKEGRVKSSTQWKTRPSIEGAGGINRAPDRVEASSEQSNIRSFLVPPNIRCLKD